MLSKFGLDGYLELPLTNEDIKVPEEFKLALDKMASRFPYRKALDPASYDASGLISVVKRNL